jgi:hypothetical protein
MFGINRKIWEWWNFFELFELPFYFIIFGDHLFVFTFGFMKKFTFQLWGFIFKLIWNIGFSFGLCICEQTSMPLCLCFFTIYRYEATNLVMLF